MARFGMVGKLVAHPGRRGELLDLLMAATRELQGADGCELYVVSHDRDDLDTIWVFEAWRDEAAHRASLNMPAVRGVIERGLPLIAERDGANLEPVGGVGLD
jgi:quinol monooxygenase YgiN